MLGILNGQAFLVLSVALAAAIPWFLHARRRTRVLILVLLFVGVAGLSVAHAEWEERRSACAMDEVAQ